MKWLSYLDFSLEDPQTHANRVYRSNLGLGIHENDPTTDNSNAAITERCRPWKEMMTLLIWKK